MELLIGYSLVLSLHTAVLFLEPTNTLYTSFLKKKNKINNPLCSLNLSTPFSALS